MRQSRPGPPRWRALSGVALALLLTGCTANSGSPEAPVTTTSSATTASSTAAPSTTAQPARAVPDNCGALLPVTDLDAALGTGLPGSVSYVRGEPLPGIGRTDRITCGYGVALGPDGKPQPALLEISVSSYVDEAAAEARIDVTTSDRQTAGDAVETTEVQGLPAVLLSGVTGTTLILADGTLTYSLTLLQAVLPPERTPTGLVSVAEAVLAQPPPAD